VITLFIGYFMQSVSILCLCLYVSLFTSNQFDICVCVVSQM